MLSHWHYWIRKWSIVHIEQQIEEIGTNNWETAFDISLEDPPEVFSAPTTSHESKFLEDEEMESYSTHLVKNCEETPSTNSLEVC